MLRRRHLLNGFPGLKLFEIDEVLQEIREHLKPSRPAGGHVETSRQVEVEVAAQRAFIDQPGADLFAQLSNGYPSVEAKAQLKALSYGTTDPILEVNAIHLLMRWWAPADDDLPEVRTFAERGIARSQELGFAGSAAVLRAQLVAFTAFELNQTLLEHHFGMTMSALAGLPATSEDLRRQARLDSLTKLFPTQAGACTSDLLSGVSPLEVSAALQLLGTAFGQVAQCLRAIGAVPSADTYIGHAKRLLLAAKDASAAAGDELGANNATYNLANQIRFHGGGAEAMQLAKRARAGAIKRGDRLLQQKADWLIESLETGSFPAYELGERRTWPSN